VFFKGGFVLLKNTDSDRFTRDIDALAKSTTQHEMIDKVKIALAKDLGDGLWYGDIKVKELAKDMPYPGIRFDAAFQIGKPQENKIGKLSRIHFDVGFGDYLEDAVQNKMHSILHEINDPIPWSVYSIEQIIAEKIHAIIAKGALNSRSKDVFDLVALFEYPELKVGRVLKCIEGTFAARSTPIPTSFFDVASGFDLTILKASWGSVETIGPKGSFEDYWEKLKLHMRRLSGS
jgi:hypothetical protein